MTVPAQTQRQQPGLQREMDPQPESAVRREPGEGRLQDRVALITGGDSGIGRAVAVAFAREGASVAIVYLDEAADAERTQCLVEAEGEDCLLISADVRRESDCVDAVAQAVHHFGRLDVVVNNAAVQYPRQSIAEISEKQIEETFRTNVFSHFFLTKAAVGHLGRGASIINTTSVTAYRGSGHLLDYSATKGAIVSFTRSLAEALMDAGIRVNAVAPGPVWTPLIPASFGADEVSRFGQYTPMKRPGQPNEIAASYVFLASDDASYMSGQVLHPNGGQPVSS